VILASLRDPRIRLEPLARRDAPGMFALWSEPRVCEYSGPAEDSQGRRIELPAASQSESNRLLQYWLDRSEAGTGFRWAVELAESNAFVGAVGFNALGRCAEYAYHFIPRHWGCGLATDASRLALAWVFSQPTERVDVLIEPGNAASIRLAERLGFEAKGRDENGELRHSLARGKA